MMRLPEDIFAECANLMGGKRHDYTAGPVHENFERSALVSSWFRDENDKVYVTLIATKLARLATLLGSKSPRNESVRDSFKDLINYSALWADSRDESNYREEGGPVESYTESTTKPATVDYDNQKLHENLAEKVEASQAAYRMIVELSDRLTNQNLRDISNVFYELLSRRKQNA